MAKDREIKYEGELNLNGLIIPCYVLRDGTRVLSGRGLQQSLGIAEKISGLKIERFTQTTALKNLFYNEKGSARYEPIPCYQGGKKITGYEATFLPEFCSLILDARDQNKLSTESQLRVAAQADVLIRALAKVGITALVDEATGYQYDREKDELQKILKQYISEELLPWQKRFPDIFYKELFRLNGWDFTVSDIKKRPGVIGTWTKKLIYEQLPKGVLDDLEANVPKSQAGNKTARLHQLLTVDVGNPHLTAQINQIITLFQLSDNMKHMWSQFEKLKNRQEGQLELPFDFDNEGHTKEPKKLSSFDHKLKKALEHDPKGKGSDS